MWWAESTRAGSFFGGPVLAAFPATALIVLAAVLNDGAKRIVWATSATFIVVTAWGWLTIPVLYRPTPYTYRSCGTFADGLGGEMAHSGCDTKRLITGLLVLGLAVVLALCAAVVARWSNRFGPRTDWSPSAWLRSWRI